MSAARAFSSTATAKSRLNGRKIIQKNLQRVPSLQVIEERLDRDARASENGCSAVDLGIGSDQPSLQWRSPATGYRHSIALRLFLGANVPHDAPELAARSDAGEGRC